MEWQKQIKTKSANKEKLAHPEMHSGSHRLTSSIRQRVYPKQELAMLYFSIAKTPHIAVNHLVKWTKRCPSLVKALREMGYRKSAKVLTPREVAVIVEYLGKP